MQSLSAWQAAGNETSDVALAMLPARSYASASRWCVEPDRLVGVVHCHGACDSVPTVWPSTLSVTWSIATSSLASTVTPKPGITTEPLVGEVILTVGFVVSGAFEPNVAMISA